MEITNGPITREAHEALVRWNEYRALPPVPTPNNVELPQIALSRMIIASVMKGAIVVEDVP